MSGGLGVNISEETTYKVKIITRIAGGIILLCMFIGNMSHEVSAQTPLRDDEKRMVVEAMDSARYDWETITLSGKLKMAGLPLSPSVKIFMQRDSSVMISLRAPLMGEVGRAEIFTDSLLVVNKMKKTYVKESLEKALSYYPGTLSDVQNLILGRVVIPGFGALDAEHCEAVEIYAEDGDVFSLIPSEMAQTEGFSYGYVIDDYARPEALLVMPAEAEGVSVTLGFEYYDNGYDLAVTYLSPKKNYSATLELDNPVEGGSPIDRIKINSRYTQLTFQQFMKSF